MHNSFARARRGAHCRLQPENQTSHAESFTSGASAPTNDRSLAVSNTTGTTVSVGQPTTDPPRLTPHDELTLSVPGFVR